MTPHTPPSSSATLTTTTTLAGASTSVRQQSPRWPQRRPYAKCDSEILYTSPAVAAVGAALSRSAPGIFLSPVADADAVGGNSAMADSPPFALGYLPSPN